MRPKVRPLSRWLAAACACLVVVTSSVSAQTVTSASVTGTVRDASEAVVPGATVDIRNHDTNQVTTTVTDARGRFRLQYLPVGAYHLSVQLTGFTTEIGRASCRERV